MTWNGYPLDEPGRDARERRMWELADEFSTRAIERERDAIRERDANLGDERRSVMAECDAWWKDEVEGKHDDNPSNVYEPGGTRSGRADGAVLPSTLDSSEKDQR